MPDILFKCSKCGKHLVADDAGAGLTMNCPDCNAPGIIPKITLVHHCDRCGQKLKFSADLKGETALCSSCDAEILLPGGDTVPTVRSERLVTFTCPECQAGLEGPEDTSAKRTECPNCHSEVYLRRKLDLKAPAPASLKQCPFCGEEIQAAAIVCKHCGSSLTAQAARQPVCGETTKENPIGQYTNAEVVAVAKKQKAIIWLILASLVVFVFPIGWILIAIVNLVFVYQLAKALKLSAAWAWCVGMIIPIVSLILLLVLNGKATTLIKSKGITVGLMGANKAQLDKLAFT